MPEGKFHGKRIVLGVTGSIAAYKAVSLVRRGCGCAESLKCGAGLELGEGGLEGARTCPRRSSTRRRGSSSC